MTSSRASRREGIPEAELRLGKQQLKGQITLSMESVSSRMYRAAGVELFGEPYIPIDEVLAKIDAITADDVEACLCRVLSTRASDAGESRAAVGP